MAMPRQALRRQRESRGLTRNEMAAKLHVSVETVRCWENGTSTPRPGFRPAIARALEVGLAEVNLWLVDQPTGHAPPEWIDAHAQMEQGAARIWQFEQAVIPGLCQTEDYARAVERVIPTPGHDDVDVKVRTRLKRQRVLDRSPNPLHLSVVLHEAALHNVAGDGDVMAGQLDHLAQLAQRPNIDLRVLSRRSGVFVAAFGSFFLISSSGTTPTMAFTENRTGLTWLSKPFEIAAHMDLFTYLSEQSLAGSDAVDLIHNTQGRTNEQHQQMA